MSKNQEDTEINTDYVKEAVSGIIGSYNLRDVKTVIESGADKGDNYLGAIYRIKLTGVNNNGKTEVISLIIKMASKREEFRSRVPVALYYGREIYAYVKMLPALTAIEEQCNLPYEDRFHYPKLVECRTSEPSEFLLFEDLIHQGFLTYNRTVPFNYDHLSFAVKCIARFHAASFVLKEKNPKLFGELVPNTANDNDHGEAFEYLLRTIIKNVLDHMEESKEKDYISDYFSNKIWTDAMTLMSSETTAPYNILCHGDCRPNNFLYAYKNGKVCDLSMLDWQLVRYSSPVLDLSYILYTSGDQEILDKHYKGMLKLYYDTLGYNISKMGYDVENLYPKNIYEEHIKVMMRFGMIRAISMMPLIIPDEDNIPDLEVLFNTTSPSKTRVTFSELCSSRLKSLMLFSLREHVI